MDLTGVTIAFDLDGTLVDTAPDLIGALNVVLGERRLPPMPIEATRVLVGRGARTLISRGFAAAGEPLDEAEVGGLTSRFIEVYRARIASESRPFPGVEAALDALARTGARLCVCTNKRTDLSIELLDALQLTAHFAAVVGADLAPARKPDPSHFIAAVQTAGGDPARAVMVGDSSNDVDSAKGAGAPVVVVSFGYTEAAPDQLGADRVIDDFGQLAAAISEVLPAIAGPRPAPVGLQALPASAIASTS